MPEGPEIRRAADVLERALSGRALDEVYFAFSALKDFEDELVGSVVTDVDTRGKALLTRFDCGLSLYSHNQLYGRWYVVRRGTQPKTTRSLRVALHNEKHSALLYSASDVEVLDENGEREHPFLSRLGPDVLQRGMRMDVIVRRLTDSKFCRRSLGALYLDQGFAAGLGNYLRSEILYLARVHPEARPADLSDQEIRRLAKLTLSVPRLSYRTRGVTNLPERARELKAAGVAFEQYRFHVFGRDSRPCYECGEPIEKIGSGGRRLYLCTTCQVAPLRASTHSKRKAGGRHARA